MGHYIQTNLLNLIGILIGVIGTAIGIVFYYRSVRVPIPSYVVPWRTRIVDKSTTNAPGLQVLHDGQPITGQDVTSAIVYFWNGGRAPIRKADVLREYALFLGEDGRLLHANVLKATRAECGVSVSFPYPMSHKVTLNFDALEYGDGVAVQLIFSGPPATPIDMAGVCIGAETIRNATEEYTAQRFRIGGWSPRISNALAPLVLGLWLGFRGFTRNDYFGVGLGLSLVAIGIFNLVPIVRSIGTSYFGSLKRLTHQ